MTARITEVSVISKLALLTALLVIGCDFFPKGSPAADPLVPPLVVSAHAMQRGDEVELVLRARHGVPTDFDLVSFPGAVTESLVVLGDGTPLEVVTQRYGGGADGADVIVELESAKRVSVLQLKGDVVVINDDRSPVYRAGVPPYVDVATPDIVMNARAVQNRGVIEVQLDVERGALKPSSDISLHTADWRQLDVRTTNDTKLRLLGSSYEPTERGGLLVLRFDHPGVVEELKLDGRLLFTGPSGYVRAERPQRRIRVSRPTNE